MLKIDRETATRASKVDNACAHKQVTADGCGPHEYMHT